MIFDFQAREIVGMQRFSTSGWSCLPFLLNKDLLWSVTMARKADLLVNAILIFNETTRGVVQVSVPLVKMFSFIYDYCAKLIFFIGKKMFNI